MVKKKDLGTYDYSVEIDVNTVLNDIPVEDLQEYLQQRIGKAEKQPTKDSILALCRHRIPRNMVWDKEEVKRAICEVVEEVW